MISGILNDGSGGLGNHLFQSLTHADAAGSSRSRARVNANPTVEILADPHADLPSVDRIASVVANALLNRVYDASGRSHSLTEEQNIQAGGIDTRR